MAENPELKKSMEREIPVFTVLKGNSILKNIYMLDKPPFSSTISANGVAESENEETLVVGRHPDCNVKLEHPSISRFHLRIHSKPSTRSLSVTDLSSVHGTWVSGKRAEPGVRIDLNDGDTLKLGGSSRLYRLQWIPVSRAYDMDNPFVPQLDVDTVDEEIEEPINQDENSMSVRNEVETLGDNLEGIEMLFSDGSPCLSDKNGVETLSENSEGLETLFSDENVCFSDKTKVETLSHNLEGLELLVSSENLHLSIKHEVETLSDDMEGLEMLFSDENLCLSYKNEVDTLSDNLEGIEMLFSDENLCLSDKNGVEILSENLEGLVSVFFDENVCFSDKAKVETLSDNLEGLESLVSFENLHLSTKIEVGTLSDDMEGLEMLFADENLCLSYKNEVDTLSNNLEAVEVLFSDENSVSAKNEENESSNMQLCNLEASTPRTLFSSSASEKDDMENRIISMEERSNPSIWLRRGKPKSVQIETGHSKVIPEISYETEPFSGETQFTSPIKIFTPDKENLSPSPFWVRSFTKKGVKSLKSESFSSLDDLDEEMFTPDKENMTPNTRLLRSMKNLEEVKHPKSYRPSPLKGAINFNPDEENQQKNVLQERSSSSKSCAVLKDKADRVPFQPLSKAKENRVPFQSLSVNSSKTVSSSACKINLNSGGSFNYPMCEEVLHSHEITEENKRWTIVVDTSCLLNKKSRKELQLLESLKGTSVHIPRVVVRELESMVKRGSFFRRTTEVSAALEWIEYCMANAKCWIHVQSTSDEGQLVPPTPPSWSIENITTNGLLFQEIATPTAKDHILDYAFSLKRSNGYNLVILSDDVTLKIKAMAEGVICETVKEFRGSLLNPFSERFLYDGSSPIGPTWRCKDDTVLKEKYYPSPSKKSVMKGLKLILQHNSNFRQIASFN